MASLVREREEDNCIFFFSARSFCTCLSFLPVCDSVIVATSGHSLSHERLQASYPLTNTSDKKHRDARVSRLASLESAQPFTRPPVCWETLRKNGFPTVEVNIPGQNWHKPSGSNMAAHSFQWSCSLSVYAQKVFGFQVASA